MRPFFVAFNRQNNDMGRLYQLQQHFPTFDILD